MGKLHKKSFKKCYWKLNEEKQEFLKIYKTVSH